MVFQLVDELLLVLFVDVLYNLRWDGSLLRSQNVTREDVWSKNKPDAAVIIPCKVASHLNNLNTVHLLNVVAHLKALFHAVVCFVAGSYHSYLVAVGAKVIFNLFNTRLIIPNWRIGSEFYYDWLPYACFWFYTSLNVTNALPLLTWSSILEKIEKICISQNLHRLKPIVFEHVVPSVVLLQHPYRDSVLVIMSLRILIFLFFLIFHFFTQRKGWRRNCILEGGNLTGFNLTEFCNCFELQLLAVDLCEWAIQIFLTFSYYVLELSAYLAQWNFRSFDWR